MKAFQYRIYPTKSQEMALKQTLETCRYLYNSSLDTRIQCYKQGKSIGYVDLANVLSGQHSQLQQQVHSQVLQDVLKRLDKAYKNFFRRAREKKEGKRTKAGFPRFKNKDRYRSFTYPQSGFRLTNDCKQIQLSKLGDIKLKYSRPVEGRIKTCTILKDVDQWFVILTCETEIIPFRNGKPTVGIDVGLTSLAVLSDGTIIDNPRPLKHSEKKLAKEQRRLSRRTKGSCNRNKQKIIVAKVNRKIRRQRSDFLHKLSTKLVKNYGMIVFEDLNIKGMLKNHCLAKHIQDAAWNQLISLTQNKAESAGSEVRLVNPRGTSQECSNCGQIVKKKLSERIHNCPSCGIVMDRDLNASLNICRAGSARKYACGDSASTLKDYPEEQAGSEKQESPIVASDATTIRSPSW